MIIAVFNANGKEVVAIVTVDEYLELPQSTITEPCGPVTLI